MIKGDVVAEGAHDRKRGGWPVRRQIAACFIGMSFFIAGCTQESEPSAPPSGDDGVKTSAEPATEAATATATPSAEEAEPSAMPTDKMENSAEGAEAFALGYLEVISQTLQNPETGLLQAYASDNCEACANYEANVDYLVANNLHVPADPIVIDEATTVDTGDPFVVQVSLDQEAYWMVEEDGSQVNEVQAVPGVLMQFNLVWESDGWLVDYIGSNY